MKGIKKTICLVLVMLMVLMSTTAFAGTKYSNSVGLGNVLTRATVTPTPTEEPLPSEAPAEETAPEATEEPVVEEMPVVEDELIAEAGYTYERDEAGNLVLDENGNPVVVIPEGWEVPLTWERDENGNLVLDENGNPIPKDTVPESAEKIDSVIDELNPDRYIDIYAAWEGEELYFGETATLIAVLYGYDNAVYTVQWQTSEDDVNWTDVENGTSTRYSLTVTEENYDNYWRIQVLISDVQ